MEGFLQRPPKTIRLVLVHSLEDQEEATDFEDRGADKRRHAPAGEVLILERRPRILQRQPHEEGIDNPDHGPQRENHGDQVRHVPVRKHGHHTKKSLRYCAR